MLEATRCGAVASPPAVVCVPLKRKANARRVNTKSRASISPRRRSIRCSQKIHMAFKALSKSEKTYIQSSLQAPSPLRGDGRSLHQFRDITLQTGVVPIANGSAHLTLGRSSDESMGGTEVLAAAKLEVEDIASLDSSTSTGVDGGRIACSVSWCVDSRLFLHGKLKEERRKALPLPILIFQRPHWTISSTTTARSYTTPSPTHPCGPQTSASSPVAKPGS